MLSHLRHMYVLVVAATVMSISNMLIIIVLRNHYTVDVLVGFWVTCTVWYFMPLGRPNFLRPKWFCTLAHKAKVFMANPPTPHEQLINMV